MLFWYWVFLILGITALILFIFGFPRKKSERIPSFEGLDDPDVAKSFEKMASFFPFKILRRRVISELKKLNPKGTLVDIGCGTGHLIVQIAEHFPTLELFGVDISPEVLEFAKQRSIAQGVVHKIKFKTGNADQLPFEDNSIDYIVSTLSLHHWADPLRVLKELNRILKRDGRFLIFEVAGGIIDGRRTGRPSFQVVDGHVDPDSVEPGKKTRL